ncbi:MAG TPA: hypothetical protein VFK58_00015 [Sphingomicrobium sp.]|nr:hypothetical protein [Sphingomicrobium sp.]
MRVLIAAFALAAASAAAAQTARPAAPAARPAPAAGAAQPARPQPAANRPVSRSVFLANMDAEFRKMDADKNGTVTRAELEAFQRAVSVLQIQARNRALFARLDRDRNGHLSAAEFAALNAAPPKPDPAPMLGRFDANRDQSISLVEYRTGTLANFDRMDTDKDGIVRPEEMRAAGARGAGR